MPYTNSGSFGTSSAIKQWNPQTDPNFIESGVGKSISIILTADTITTIDNIPAGTRQGTIIYFNKETNLWSIASQSDEQQRNKGIFLNPTSLNSNLPAIDQVVGSYALVQSTNTYFLITNTSGSNLWVDTNSGVAPTSLQLSDIDTSLNNASTTRVAPTSSIKTLNDSKQPKTDNTLSTTSKNIVGAINENKANIDLVYTKIQVDNFLNLKVDKISGKGLSTEDYTTSEKSKLAGIAEEATKNQTDAYLLNRTNHTGTQLASTISDFQAAVSLNQDVIDSKDAKHTHLNKALLDTYDQTNVDISDAISKKHTHSNKTILDNTTASYTIAEANKLAGIQAGAEANVNADWNSTTGDSQILNKPDLTLKKDRLNNALVRFASSNGLASNDGKDNDKPTNLQNAHDTINASGVIYLETGTYQNTWNQTPVQTTLLNITKSNITLVCQDFSNGSKADIRWRTWTANTVLKAGDIVADPDDVNSPDSTIRMNYKSWVCNSNRTTSATWNSTEKAFFTENITIPLIKFSSTLRGQVKGLTVRGKRAFTIESVPSSGAGVHSFEYCGDLNLYLKTAFYGQLIVDNGNLTLEYDSSLTTGATATIDLSNLRYINLIKPKAITSVRSSQFIAVDSIAAQGSIFDIKNSRYINILSHTNGQLLIDSSTEIMNVISTANKLNVAGYDYNKVQITNSNFNYINVLNGQQSIGLLQKTGDCPHYIRNCIGLDVSQASFLNFALNGESLVFPRANAINQSTIPSATDDIAKGWDLGSTWTLSTGTVYTCYSNAINNAVWASSDNILPEVADKTTLESTYLIGFGNTTSYAGKYISVVNANGLPITSGTISDGRTANYQIKVGTSGDTASQLTYKSSIAPVQVSGGGVQINDSVISSTSTYSSNKINTELATKENTITTLPIAKGGTNSSTALTNDKVIISEDGKLIESLTTKTQLSYLDATSSIQTQINAKANDSEVVKLNGNQSISGDKTFNGKILAPNALLTSNVDSYLVIENNEIKKQTLAIPDKHFGNSTDSITITNSGSLTFTIEVGLFFYPLQDVIVYHDNLNHMHGQITSYNSTTGEIVIDITNKTGSGTYSSWKIYYDGATSSSVNLVDNLTTQDANSALTANQGYVLNQNKVDKTTTINSKALSSNITLNTDEITEANNKFVSAAQKSAIDEIKTKTIYVIPDNKTGSYTITAAELDNEVISLANQTTTTTTFSLATPNLSTKSREVEIIVPSMGTAFITIAGYQVQVNSRVKFTWNGASWYAYDLYSKINKSDGNSLVLSYVLTGITTATTWAKLTTTNTIKQLADFSNLIYDRINLKADDSAVLHKTGNETATGVKTFQTINLSSVNNVSGYSTALVRTNTGEIAQQPLSSSGGTSFQEPLTIRSTGTVQPVKATVTQYDYILLNELGNNWCDISLHYSALSNAGANGGNGVLIFQLPTGYYFDLSFNRFDNNANNNISNYNLLHLILAGSSGIVSYNGSASTAAVVPQNNTYFKIVTLSALSGAGHIIWYYLSNTYYNINSSAMNIQVRFKCKYYK
jgi:hypothetical protein